MSKKTLVKQVLFGRIQKTIWLCLFVAAFVAANVFIDKPEPVRAATSNTMNFQARLLTSSGSVVPDGYYNVEFKLYSQSAGGSALWTETYYDTNGGTAGTGSQLRVVNGYLTVNLNSVNNDWGSVTDWSEEMWLTMNIGGTSSSVVPSASNASGWDGEMSPRLKLTAVPYAFEAANADKLGGVDAANYAQLGSSQTFTGYNTFQNASNSTTAFRIQNAAGTSLFVADTTNSGIGITGTLSVSSHITTQGNINAQGSISAGNGYSINNGSSDAGYIAKAWQLNSTVVAGEVVVMGTATVGGHRAVELSTTPRDPRVVGVVRVGNSSGSNTEIVIAGNTTIRVDAGAVAIGDQLVVSSTSGRATVDNDATTGIIGYATTAKAGGSVGTVGVRVAIINGQSTPNFRSDSTTAFRIQNAAGDSNLFIADTTNGKIGIGVAPVSYGATLQVSGNIGASGTVSGNDVFAYGTYRISMEPTTFGTVAPGDVVIYNEATDKHETTTTPRDTRVKGVNVSSWTEMAIMGNVLVNVDSAQVNLGDQLVTSTTAGRATVDNNATTGIVGYALSSKSAGSPGQVYVQLHIDGGQSAPRFQNATNSTTAFQIQDANALNTLFTADTTNNRMVIGDGDDTSDANTTMLVVDSASTANLPIGVNGGIIYDSTENNFKVFANGQWKVLCNVADGNCGGGASTLQDAYNGSTDPEITVDATRGALTVRDASSAIGNSLFEVQNNDGTISYFSVAADGTVVRSGTNSATAFQIQDAAGTSNLLVADTVDNKIGIGTVPGGGRLTVQGLAGGIAGTGTLAKTADTPQIYGTGTSFLSDLKPGYTITAGGQTWTVKTVASDTTIEVNDWSGGITAGTSYTYSPSIQTLLNSNGDLLAAFTIDNGLDLSQYGSNAPALTLPGGHTFRNFSSGNSTNILDISGGITTTLYSPLMVPLGSSSAVAAVIRGQSGQSGDLLQAQASDTSILARITATGSIISNDRITAQNFHTSYGFSFDSGSTNLGNINKMTHASGSVGARDVVVISDTMVGGAFTVNTTNTPRHPKVVGVSSQGGTDQGVYVVTYGFATVNADAGAVAVGDQLVTSSTTGHVTVDNNATTGIVGRALTAKAGGSNGTVDLLVNPINGTDTPVFRNQSNSTTAFQIQDAGGLGLFTVDTENSEIKVENAKLLAQYIDIPSSAPVGISRTSRVNTTSSGAFGTGTYTPATTFSPGANKLLLAYVAWESYNTPMSNDASEVNLSGGSLTWTEVSSRCRNDGNWCQGYKVFYALTGATPPSNMQVSVSASGSSIYKYAVMVDEMSGVDLVNPIVGAVSADRLANDNDTFTANLGATPSGDDWKITMAAVTENVAGSDWDVPAGWTSLYAPNPNPSAAVMYQTGSTSPVLNYDLNNIEYDGTASVYGGFILKGAGGEALNIGTQNAGIINIGSTSSSTVLAHGSGGVLIQGTDTTTAFRVQNSNGDTVFNVDTDNERVGFGTNAPTRQVHVALNNTDTTAMPLLVEQSGTGDSGIEIKNTAQSYYMGIDSSDSNKFKISSSSATGSQGMLGYSAVEGSVDTGITNVIGFTRGVASISGNITTIKAYINSTGAGNVKMQASLYADNGTRPNGAALAVSNELNATAGSNWYEFTIPSVAVTSGTKYWIGYTTNGENNNYYASAATHESCYYSYTYSTGTFPNVGSCTTTAGKRIMYAVIDSAGGASDNLNTSLFEMTTSGSATFRNSTNSTTAFQIQNSSGSSLFKVDTTNSIIALNGGNGGVLRAWTTSTNPMNVSGARNRSEGAATVVNGYIYQVGGTATNDASASAAVMYAKLNNDGSNGTWTDTTAIPAARVGHDVVSANGYIYVIGGRSTTTSKQTTIYYGKVNADGTVSSWTTSSLSLPQIRTGLRAIAAHGHLYVIGGESDTVGYRSQVFISKLGADGSLGSWRCQSGDSGTECGGVTNNNANGIPNGRSGGTVLYGNGFLYYIGGYAAGVSDDVYYAEINNDGSTSAWTTNANDIPAARGGTIGGIMNGYMYIAGGWTGSAYSDDVYYAPLNTNGTVGTWTTSASDLPVAMNGNDGVTYNGYIYSLGGSNGTATNAVYYTSTARVQIAGGLDLVGLNGGTATDGGTGGELTAGNTNVLGTLDVRGAASFGGSVTINETLAVGSSALFRNSTNSTTAFQVQNASGVNMFNVDTVNSKVEIFGGIYMSGLSWTTRSSAANSAWNSVTYGNGLFVAVTNSFVTNRAMTSPDGANWTSRATPTGNFQSVTYGNGLFVAVGASNAVMTSSDGINWTARTGTGRDWQSVTYGNGLFVAVAYSGTGNRVMTSPDGINWTSRTSAGDHFWQSVTYGNGLFVAVSSNGSGSQSIMTSPDGITWTIQNSPDSTAGWMSVTYGNGLFVAVRQSGSGQRVMTSVNGTSWTIRSTPVDLNWQEVTYGAGLYVAVSSNVSAGQTNGVMTSPDGINWTNRTASIEKSWTSIVHGNGVFAVVASDVMSNMAMSSGVPTISSVQNNNTYQGGMTVYGDSAFKSAANSTTAFQIQNATGGSLFTADTTNSNITINGANNGLIANWQTDGDTLPSARDAHATVHANGYIYVIGGHNSTDGSTPKTTVMFAKLNANGSTGAWSCQGASGTGSSNSCATTPVNANTLPAARSDLTAVYANGYLYAIGGYNGSAAVQTIYYAKVNTDGTTSAWNTATSQLPAARYGHSSVVANGYIYAIAGHNGSSGQRTTLYAKLNADGSIGSWSCQTQSADVANCGTAPRVNDNILANLHWDRGTFIANGYVYLAGGSNGSATTAVEYAKLNADGSTGAWTTESDTLPLARQAATAFAVNGYAYVVGGASATSLYYAPIQSGGGLGAWQTDSITEHQLPANRAWTGYAGVSVNGYMYVVGGSVSGGGASSNTTYYTSTARTQIGGSLDLVGITGQDMLDAGSQAGSLTAGNTNVLGNLDVRGSAAFSQGVSVGGTLSVNDRTHIALNTSDTNNMALKVEQKGTGDSGIEIKNSAQSYYVGIDSSDGNMFKIGSSTASGGQANMGNNTTAGSPDTGSDDSVSFMKVVAPLTGTVSTMNVYVSTTGVGGTSAQVAIYAHGGTFPTGTPLGISSQATLTNGSAWNTFTFSSPISVASGTTYWLAYTTNGDNNPYATTGPAASSCFDTSEPYVTGSFPNASSAGSCGTLLFDAYAVIDSSSGVSDNLATSLFRLSNSGAATFQNSTNSTAAFQIQNAAGSNVITADTTNTRVLIGSASAPSLATAQLAVTIAEVQTTLRVGGATNGFSFNDTGTGASGKLRLYGTARNTKKLVLTPEFAGAVLDGSGIGTMTAAYDGTQRTNYYKWTTTQVTSQTFDVVVTMSVPSDWSAWAPSNAISVNSWTSHTTNSTGALTVISTNGTTDVNATSITPGSTSTWTTTNANLTSSSIYVADGTMVIRMRMSANNNSSFQLGNVTLTYLSQF